MPRCKKPAVDKTLTEDYLKTIDVKEDDRLDALIQGFVARYGPGAHEAIEKAQARVLAAREAKAIDIFAKLLTEKYGADAKDIIEKAKAEIIVMKEPVNNVAFGEALSKVYGPEAFQIMRKAIRDFWIPRVPALMKQLGVTERDAIGAMKVVSYMHKDMGKVIEATPKRAVREETFCRYTEMFTPLYCDVVSGGGVEGIAYGVNPKLVARQDKYLTAGDGCCRTIIEMKD